MNKEKRLTSTLTSTLRGGQLCNFIHFRLSYDNLKHLMQVFKKSERKEAAKDTACRHVRGNILTEQNFQQTQPFLSFGEAMRKVRTLRTASYLVSNLCFS